MGHKKKKNFQKGTCLVQRAKGRCFYDELPVHHNWVSYPGNILRETNLLAGRFASTNPEFPLILSWSLQTEAVADMACPFLEEQVDVEAQILCRNLCR